MTKIQQPALAVDTCTQFFNGMTMSCMWLRHWKPAVSQVLMHWGLECLQGLCSELPTCSCSAAQCEINSHMATQTHTLWEVAARP